MIALLLPLVLALPQERPELSPGTLDAHLERILPGAEELEWEAIGWRASLAGAIEEAREQGRPILLWAMNGHPLGCV